VSTLGAQSWAATALEMCIMIFYVEIATLFCERLQRTVGLRNFLNAMAAFAFPCKKFQVQLKPSHYSVDFFFMQEKHQKKRV